MSPSKPGHKAKKAKTAKRREPARMAVLSPPTKARVPSAEIVSTNGAPEQILAAQKPSPQPATEGRYVYGIIEANQSTPLQFGKIGIGGAGEMVYTVHHGDVAAVVSRTSQVIFDPTRENALAHEH